MKNFTQDKKLYKNLMQIDQMKLDYEEVLQIVKIKDLHSFGSSIIEIMVGRSEFSQVANLPKNQSAEQKRQAFRKSTLPSMIDRA